MDRGGKEAAAAAAAFGGAAHVSSHTPHPSVPYGGGRGGEGAPYYSPSLPHSSVGYHATAPTHAARPSQGVYQQQNHYGTPPTQPIQSGHGTSYGPNGGYKLPLVNGRPAPPHPASEYRPYQTGPWCSPGVPGDPLSPQGPAPRYRIAPLLDSRYSSQESPYEAPSLQESSYRDYSSGQSPLLPVSPYRFPQLRDGSRGVEDYGRRNEYRGMEDYGSREEYIGMEDNRRRDDNSGREDYTRREEGAYREREYGYIHRAQDGADKSHGHRRMEEERRGGYGREDEEEGLRYQRLARNNGYDGRQQASRFDERQQGMKTNEGESRGSRGGGGEYNRLRSARNDLNWREEIDKGVDERGFRRNDRREERWPTSGGKHGFGYGAPRAGEGRGGDGSYAGQWVARLPDGDSPREKSEMDGERRGQREEEQGGGTETRAANCRRDDGRKEIFGGPRSASLPLNSSREYEDLWASLIHQFNTPRKRIRWQIVTILKNVRDRNRLRIAQGEELEFEMIEFDSFFNLVMMGSGNEMELFEATVGVDLPGDDVFFNFLRDMESSGLCTIYEAFHADDRRLYVTSPDSTPPLAFGLTRPSYYHEPSLKHLY